MKAARTSVTEPGTTRPRNKTVDARVAASPRTGGKFLDGKPSGHWFETVGFPPTGEITTGFSASFGP